MRACPSLQIVIIFPILSRFIHNSVYYINFITFLKRFRLFFFYNTKNPLFMQKIA